LKFAKSKAQKQSQSKGEQETEILELTESLKAARDALQAERAEKKSGQKQCQ